MPAANHNFIIEQGSNFFITFEYLDNNSVPIDLTNYCIILKFRNSADKTKVGQYSSNVVSNNYRLRKNSSGIIEWYLSFNETRTFNFDSADYDLYIVNNLTEEYTRLCTGTINIIKTNFPECDGNISGSPCNDCDQISISDAWSSEGIGTIQNAITFFAPFSGIITAISVTGNQIVNINDPLLTITRGVANTTPTPSTSGSTSGTNPLPSGNNPVNLNQEDLCDYLCQGLDLFGKMYKYSENLVYSNQTSGNFNITSNQSIFSLPNDIYYVSGNLDIYINGTGLRAPTQFVANNNKTFMITNLGTLGRNINSAVSGDVITWINKGVTIQDDNDNTQTYTMNISDTGLINNLEVTINNLKHNNPQDLAIFLVSPGGHNILLSAYSKINNYDSTNGLNFTFSNKARQNTYLYNRSNNDLYVNIHDKTHIYNLSNFTIPEAEIMADLSVVNGMSASGDWRLMIQDHDPGSSGTIDGWSLIVTYPPIGFLSE